MARFEDFCCSKICKIPLIVGGGFSTEEEVKSVIIKSNILGVSIGAGFHKEILSIAGGRIWSGEKALQLGLVDKIGDLDDAVKSAANFANLDDYMVVSYSKEMDPFDLFINELLNSFGSKINTGSEIKMLAKIIDSNYKFIDLDKKINTAIYCFECEYFSSQ